jgi:hypothetical protein
MMMVEISESEAQRRSGDQTPELLAKAERDTTDSAVALQRYPDCFVLGLSCDADERTQLFAFEREDEARSAYARHVARMHASGTPFFD